MEVWHKHQLSILSNFTRILFRCLVGVSVHNRRKVGVIAQKVGVVRTISRTLILFSTLSQSLLL